MQDFAKKQAPSAEAQHRLGGARPRSPIGCRCVGDWKKQLGSQWDQTYAASNTIYVTRQNNVLFSVLAQFFGPEAINDRLLLV